METTADTQAPLEELSSSNTDEVAEIAALARALKRSHGFTLLFACCDDSTRREEVTRELSAACPTGTVAPRVVYLRKGENIANLAAVLRARLADGPLPGAVFVDGLVNILPRASEAGRSAFVANLNAYRNALPAIVPCPLILWVTDWLLGVLARSAPDFFSVKSGIYFFREDVHSQRELSPQASEIEPNLGWENVSHDELRARAEEIRAMLDASRADSGENSLLEARLAIRLGAIYLTLYQLHDAETAYARSLTNLEKRSLKAGNDNDKIADGLAAITYHQLGIVAQERRDFAAAESWYLRSLEIEEHQGNAHGAAASYQQLGSIALEQRDFAAAEGWYRRSLEIEERQGNEHGAAVAYHQLGRIAQEQRDFAAAEGWYRRSLDIEERQGNEHGAAISYQQLGSIALEQRDFAAAEGWYRRSLEIKERQGDEHGAAMTYHQLGRIAQEQRDFAAAEGWYRRSLEIKERQGNEHGAAMTYHQLGRIAQEQRDFAAAEGWYRRSLEIKERQGNEHGTALTCGQLGIIAGMQDDFASAGGWLLKSIGAFIRVHDERGAQRNMRNFLIFYRRATGPLQAKLKAMWEAAQIGPFPSEMGDDTDDQA